MLYHGWTTIKGAEKFRKSSKKSPPKGIWMRRQDLNIDRLIEYTLRMDIGAVIRRLCYLLELYGIGNPEQPGTLPGHLTKTYARLDPMLPAEGKFTSKWRLQLNVTPEELQAVVKT